MTPMKNVSARKPVHKSKQQSNYEFISYTSQALISFFVFWSDKRDDTESDREYYKYKSSSEDTVICYGRVVGILEAEWG